MKKYQRHQKLLRGNANRLRGERGLLVAIVLRAYNDYYSGNKEHATDAARYFASAEYRQTLRHLNLPEDLIPEGVNVYP